MACKVCNQIVRCDVCESSGEIWVYVPNYGRAHTDCPKCHGLHVKCKAILDKFLADLYAINHKGEPSGRFRHDALRLYFGCP